MDQRGIESILVVADSDRKSGVKLYSVVCGDEGSGGATELSGCGPATLFHQWTKTKLALVPTT